MSKYNLMDLYEGMSDKDYDAAKEKERLDAHPEKDTILKIKSLLAKEKSSKNESEVEEVSSRVGSRIEGLLNIKMKNKFLDAGMDLIQDLLEDDPFDIGDVIDHLAIELNKHWDSFERQGDRLASLEEIEETESIEELANPESVDALTALIGAGGLAGGAVALNKLMDALEAGKLGSKGEAVAKFLRDAGSTFRGAGLKEDNIDELANPESVDALTALIGAGGLAGGAVALSKLMDSLEAGKLGDKGKAVAKFLRDAGSTFSGQGAPMKEEELEETPGPKNPDGTPKSNDEMTDDEREDYYNNLDSVDESKEDKELKEHFSRFLKDYK
jgi:hypothetical protein